MKVLFTDFDGVLCPWGPTQDLERGLDHIVNGGCYLFNKSCVERFNTITNETGAVIVVISSWRHYIRSLSVMSNMLKAQGVAGKLLGMTPEAHESWKDQSRGAEVIEYMRGIHGIESFAILDDADMGWKGLEKFWVKPHGYLGIQPREVNRSINLLKHGKQLQHCN